MSLIINLIVGLIAFYFAYMYATRKPMLVKVPWYETATTEIYTLSLHDALPWSTFFGEIWSMDSYIAVDDV